MLLADLVATSKAVGSTRSRSAKVGHLAEMLSRLEDGEIVAAVALLSGQPRQGKVGVGWSTVSGFRTQPAPEASLTLLDFDDAIDVLASTSGTGSGAARSAILHSLFERATDAEQQFIRRVLLGEVRQGALEGLMVDAIAKAASLAPAQVRRAVMLAGDIPSTARIALREGSPGVDAIGLAVLRPVLPMLASSAPDIEEAVKACGESSVEWKLDGIRVQAHRDGDAVRLFTRNLNDATERLPGVVEAVRSMRCDCVILDGEVVGRLLRFFDCLHRDGRDLIDLPLRLRMQELREVAGEYSIPSIVTSDAAEASTFLDAALAAGHEGVMVKGIESLYEAGRRGSAWRKVKPVRTFDLVVIGAEWGSGRRQGWLSNLHLGARTDDGKFVMVGKTFKGLTDALLRWQTEEFLARETARHGIVVEVRPELVVEIALDSVHASTRYEGGIGLRFARVKRYRPDKSPQEADTIGDLRALLDRG